MSILFRTFAIDKENKSNQLKITIMEKKEMKVSNKMRKTISRLEKKYGKLNKDFFIETNEKMRVGNGFYDGCTLTCDILKDLCIVVAHDGSYYIY